MHSKWETPAMLTHNGRDTSHIDLVFTSVSHKDCSISVKVKVLEMVFWNSSCHAPVQVDISGIWTRPPKPKRNSHKMLEADPIIMAKWSTLCPNIYSSCINLMLWAATIQATDYTLQCSQLRMKQDCCILTSVLQAAKKVRRIPFIWKEAGKPSRGKPMVVAHRRSSRAVKSVHCRYNAKKKETNITRISWKPQPETRNCSTSWSVNIRPYLISPMPSW